MRSVLGVIAVLIVCIVALGFFRGWFQMSSSRDRTDQKVNTTFTVDEGRIQEDREKVQGFVDQPTTQSSETSAGTE